MNTTTDVGSFRFIADALHTNVDTAVQYFIFTLIGVFDPLAVALVLAWNKLIERRSEKKKEDDEEYLKTLNRGGGAPDGVIIMPSKVTDEVAELVQSTSIKNIPAAVKEEKSQEIKIEPPKEELAQVEKSQPSASINEQKTVTIVPEIIEELPKIQEKSEPVKDMVSNVPIADVEYG
jgi:hypothetical protein